MAEVVPGVVFSVQTSTVPPELIFIDLTLLSDDPTLKAEPGLVTVKAPLLNVQLSAVEPLKIIISAVLPPKVTALTVIFPSATKSVVAAKPIKGMSNKDSKIVR